MKNTLILKKITHLQKIKKYLLETIFVYCALIAINVTYSENLFRDNSSFEVGNWGFQAIPYVFVQDWANYEYPKITDQTAAKGKYSLEISNPLKRSQVMVWFPAFKVKSNTKIVCSFYAKSDTAETQIIGVVGCGFKYILSKNFKLSTSWKRYSIEGVLGINIQKEISGGGLTNHYAFYLNLPSTKKPIFNKIWIDAVQIEKKHLTGYAPAKKLDAAIELSKYSKKRFLIYKTGKKEVASVNIFLESVKRSAYTVDYQVIDELNAKVYLKASQTGTIIDEHAVVKFNLPQINRRLYRIKAKISVGQLSVTANRLYAGINDLSNANLQGKFGGSGIALAEPSSLRKYYIDGYDPKYNLASYKYNPDTIMKIAKALGWRWVHDYQSVGILVNQSKKGVYNWDGSDYLVDLYLKNGFKIMSNITSAGIFNTYQMPKWLLTGKPSLGGTWSTQDGLSKADVKEFGDFCKIVAKRYAGKIDEWESWNEPGVIMQPSEYMPYLKACYKNIKEGNPRAKVIGLTGTKDRSGDAYGWVAKCMELGAGDYMDAIALHGYHIENRHYGNSVRDIAKSIKNKSWQIWDTESGVISYEPYEFKYFFAASENNVDTSQGITLYKPADGLNRVSKHWLNEVVSGMTRISYFNFDTEYRLLGKATWGAINYDGSPNAVLIAQNFLIEFLDDATFYKEISMEGGTIAYVFEKGNSSFIAYWNDNFNKKITIMLDNIQVLDGLGSPVELSKDTKNNILIPVGTDIHYLVASKLNAEKLVLESKEFKIKDLNPIKLISSKINTVNGKVNLELTIKNIANDSQNISVNIISRFNDINIDSKNNIYISSFSKSKIILPIDISSLKHSFNKNLKFAIETSTKSLLFTTPLKIMLAKFTSTVIDYNLSNNILDSKESDVLLGDFANVTPVWNKEGLYFLIKVIDKDPMSYKKSKVKIPIYLADCVEIFFDWDRENDINIRKFNYDDTQLFFAALGDNNDIGTGSKSSSGNAKFPIDLIKMKSSKTSNGYKMQINIPWKCLEKLNIKQKSIIGFSISVKDVDKYFIEHKKAIWAGDGNIYKDTSKFGLLKMIK